MVVSKTTGLCFYTVLSDGFYTSVFQQSHTMYQWDEPLRLNPEQHIYVILMNSYSLVDSLRFN